MMKKFFLGIMWLANSLLWQGCEYETIRGPVSCEEHPVGLELVSVEDSNCALQDGKVEVMATGGSGNYRFRLANTEQSDGVFLNLAAGVYQVSVTDNNNCSTLIEATVKNKSGLNITFQTSDAGCNSAQGNIEITPAGGTPPYQFQIDGGTFSSGNTFSSLSHGAYTIVVNDASGCEVRQSIEIKSGVSYSGSVSDIIKTNCAISDCHSGSQFPDFRVFKNIHDNASQIKILTGNGTMPQEGTLTQAEINTIACWVDDGALEN